MSRSVCISYGVRSFEALSHLAAEKCDTCLDSQWLGGAKDLVLISIPRVGATELPGASQHDVVFGQYQFGGFSVTKICDSRLKDNVKLGLWHRYSWISQTWVGFWDSARMKSNELYVNPLYLQYRRPKLM